jgi:type II secretory pathway component PulF
MLFKYTISTKEGEIKKGEVEAPNREEVINKFLAEDYLIISLKEAKKKINLIFYLEKVGDLDKIYFFKNLSLMLRAGLPVPEIIDTLSEMVKSVRFKKVLIDIKKRTESGSSLYSAFSFYPEIFSPLILGLIKLGEETGQLEESSEHLHSLLLSRYEFKKEVKTALIYPSTVIVLAIGVFISIFLFLLPRLTKLFTSLSVKPPLITRIMIGSFDFFQKNLFYIFTVLGALILAYVLLYRNKKIKRFFQGLDLSLPVIGRILKKINLSYFAKNLGLLLKSGMPAERAFLLNMEITENEAYKEIVGFVLEGIRKGNTIASTLSKFPRMFSKDFTKTIESGERSGNLSESLSYLSSFYEKEVERETKDLTISLEPMLLIFVGLVVAFIAIAIISPIYQYVTALDNVG